MKYEQYANLIEKLEKYAAENPQAYELRVTFLTALGYAYFFALIFLFLGLPVLLVLGLWFIPGMLLIAIKLGKLLGVVAVVFLGALGVGWSLVKALWTKVPPPEAAEILPEQAPVLFKLVKETSDYLKAPVPDHILLTEEFNAAVVTLPKYGIFGKRVYLIVGLPLMQAVSVDQFRAILAHETGHISRRHGRFATWIYRVQETWGRFLDQQEAVGGGLSFLYERFAKWYFPYFRAYSFVLCRNHEREADAYAVQFVGARPLGESLINLDIKSRNISQTFWKEVLDEAGREKTPPKEVFTRMANAFRESNPAQDWKNLASAVAVNTDYSDTHPSLGERLRTIGYWNGDGMPELPTEVTNAAAEHFLGPLEKHFEAVFNQEWEERVKDQWRERHDYIAETKEKLEKLNERIVNGESLSEEELYQRASMTAECEGNDRALPLLQSMSEEFPENAHAQFAIGSILINEKEDLGGISYIERAIELDTAYRMSGFELLYFFLRSKGRDAEAKKYALDIEKEQEVYEQAQIERSGVFPTDTFLEHDFEPQVIEEIRSKIRYYDEIAAAYLVKKRVAHYEKVPCYVMFIDPAKQSWLKKSGTLNSEDLLAALVNRLGGYNIHFFVILEQNFAGVKPKLETVGAPIYRAE